MFGMLRRSPAIVPTDARTRRRFVPGIGLVFGAIIVVLAALGCNPIREPGYHSSDYRPKYKTPAADDVVFIKAADLGVPDSAMTGSGVNVLDTQASAGRFPAGLSVVQVAAAMNEKDAGRHLQVEPLTPHGGVYWSQIMEDLPPIREVRVLRTYGHDPRGTDRSALLQSSLESDCGLCVIFAKIEDTDADAEFVGVLWDATTDKALATYRVPLVLPDDVRERYEDDDEDDIDYEALYAEAEFRAECDLRRLVRNTLWDLVERDARAATTQPNPWKTDNPVFPRDHYSHPRFRRLLERARRSLSGD
jgi:hypothetical protein